MKRNASPAAWGLQREGSNLGDWGKQCSFAVDLGPKCSCGGGYVGSGTRCCNEISITRIEGNITRIYLGLYG